MFSKVAEISAQKKRQLLSTCSQKLPKTATFWPATFRAPPCNSFSRVIHNLKLADEFSTLSKSGTDQSLDDRRERELENASRDAANEVKVCTSFWAKLLVL